MKRPIKAFPGSIGEWLELSSVETYIILATHMHAFPTAANEKMIWWCMGVMVWKAVTVIVFKASKLLNILVVPKP